MDDLSQRPDPFDNEDFLEVRADLKEWFFFAESLPDTASYGAINFVQYRFTPVSVNVGYSYGSVETFEYGRAEAGAPTNTNNGVPQPYLDQRRL